MNHRRAEGSCRKAPGDMARYLAAMSVAQPGLVVELGTGDGTSAAWLASAAGCPVVTVGENELAVAADVRRTAGPAVTWLTGRSTDPLLVGLVAALAANTSPVLVVLAAGRPDPEPEARLYGALVTPGSYLVVEHPNGPADQWAAEQPGWHPDQVLAALLPGGHCSWWRRDGSPVDGDTDR